MTTPTLPDARAEVVAALYAERDVLDPALRQHYIRNVDAMTREGLYAKSDIAAELAWRDAELAAVIAERDALRRFHAIFSGKTEHLFFSFGMDGIDAYNAALAEAGEQVKP